MTFSVAKLPLPIRIRPEVPMTDEELLRFCAANELLRVEREANGEIVIMTPTGSEGSHLNLRIGRFLDEWAEQDGRGVAFDSNGGFSLPDGSMRAADAAWVQKSRWEALSAEKKKGFAPLCPDFVIELRSPSDRLSALQEKMQQWIANGAQLAWLIDPIDRTVSVYRSGSEPDVHQDPSSVQGDGVMAGFELVMARVWD
jgi:Uma2 family endonuclease